MDMDYLGRDDAPFSGELWTQIDQTVVSGIKQTLVGRRFLPLYGPLGGSVRVATIDAPGHIEEFEDGFVSTSNRSLAEVPQLYADFWLNWRDMENARKDDRSMDLSAARSAAFNVARTEDRMVFYGNERLGIKGLLTVEGSQKIARHNWNQGENPFLDVAAGVTALEQADRLGRYALILSSDMYLQLERLQPNTGLLERARVADYLDGRVFKSTVLEEKTAVLVCCESPYMDLLVGQDFATAYLEMVDLNHHLRIMETALLRIKAPDAIVVFSE